MAKIMKSSTIRTTPRSGGNLRPNDPKQRFAPNQEKTDCTPIQQGHRLAVPDDTPTKKISDKWDRIFAEHLKQDRDRLVASRASSPKPKFNHAAWRHRPLGEPNDRKTISKKKGCR
jgi:hypothetical protein